MEKDSIRGLSIFHRLLATFLGVTVVFGGALVFAFYSFNRQSLERHTREHIIQHFESIQHDFVDHWQQETVTSLKLMAANPLLDEFIMSLHVGREIHTRSVERLFRQYLRYKGNYKHIYFVDPLGKERIMVDRTEQGGRYRDLRRSELFRRLASTAAGTISMEGPFRDKDGEAIFSLGISTANSTIGKFGGILIIDFGLQKFFDYLERTSILGENPIWVIAPDGEVLKQPLTKRGSLDPRPYLSPGYQKERNFRALGGGLLVYQDMFIIPGQRLLRLIISVPSSLLFEDARWVLKFLSVVFILFLFLASLVVFYLSKYFSMPIVELARAAAAHARGCRFSHVKMKTSGEVQLLVDSFNSMVEDLEKSTVSRAYVDNIIDSMQEVLIVLSPEGRIIRVNKAAVKLLEYEEKELIGQQMGLITAGESSGEDGEDMWKGYFSGNAEKTFLARDGRQIPVLFSAAMMWDSHNSFQGVVCVAQNITEMKKTAQELIETRRAAEESSRIKSEFLANVSHEIRTPMNGIMGMTALTLETDLNKEQRDYLETIQRSANALLDIINDILDFSKIEAGKMSLEVISFNLRMTMEGVIDTLAPQAAAKGLAFKCLVDSDVPSMLKGDPGRLRQILINFGSNAVKFTHRGEVVIKVELQEEREDRATLLFSVTDTGIGIPRGKQDIIFDAFVQADGSTTRLYGGTGLGLSIAKNLAGMMGGKIGVESEVGRGSRFWFAVTFTKQGEQEEKASSGGVPPDLKDLRGLVVDDTETNGIILVKMLERFGCRAEAVTGGAEAIRVLKEASLGPDPFRILFLDMQMPGMDGGDTAAIIRHTAGISTIPIVVLTSLGRRGEVSHVRGLGCDGYLIKPVRQSSLLDTIAAVMSTRGGNGNVVTRHTIREKKLRDIKILLAEDNPMNRKVALAVLKKEGYQADTAENGFLAVEMAGRKNYDLILMDVQMPGIDGAEATRLIREKERGGTHAVIIAMTAHNQSDSKDRCRAAGMDDYIAKPLEPSEVFSVLGKWFKGMVDGIPPQRKEDGPVGAEPPGDGSSSDAIIDMESAMSRFGDDREFYRELIGDFLNYVPETIAALEEALRMRDTENIQGYAHSIRGAAGNLSARKVFSTALRIEHKAGDGVLADVPLLIEELKSEIARLKELKFP